MVESGRNTLFETEIPSDGQMVQQQLRRQSNLKEQDKR